MPDLDLSTWISLGVSVVAFALVLRVLTEGRRAGAIKAELEEARSERKARQKQQEKRDKALREAESRAEKTARKLAQADRRASQSRDGAKDERGKLAARIEALERDLSEGRAEAERREGELTRTRLQLESTTERVARAEATAAASVAAAERAESERLPAIDPGEIEALRERVAAAEAHSADRETALAQAVSKAERLAARLETETKLYASIRSELAVEKDQIRQQREEIERLQATKVVLVDAPATADPEG